ncbi:UTP:RNA uridylyltransferase 1-like [Rutidosis leptorrhynchoides]|uniref:UTP:RNA uridylyltransferase 1-like n=1 Tax=Rutidosis leptorrhynchoides TaxID=125765 RepID=UPI003A990B5B
MEASSLLNERQRMYRRTIPCSKSVLSADDDFVKFYESLIPTEDEMQREGLRKSLKEVVAMLLPQAELFVYGSSATLLGFKTSDINMCVVVDDDANRIEDTLFFLETLATILKDKFDDVKVVKDEVPKLKFKDFKTGIPCDISVNNQLALENTKLVNSYREIDPRLPQLVVIVKKWAKSRGVNDAFKQTRSSYA